VLTTAKTTFEANKNQATEKAVKDAEFQVKNIKSNKDIYLNGVETKIKVEAYFTKNKSKTKVQKDFTVTANGIK
jgi:translation initiation factor IF-3